MRDLTFAEEKWRTELGLQKGAWRERLEGQEEGEIMVRMENK